MSSRIITFAGGPPTAVVWTDGLVVHVTAVALGMYMAPEFTEEQWREIGYQVTEMVKERRGNEAVGAD